MEERSPFDNIDIRIEDRRATKYLTPRGLRQVLSHYLLPECVVDVKWSKLGFDSDHFLTDDGEQILNNLLKSDRKLRMYEPVEELIQNINLYRIFQSSHSYFNMRDEDPYSNIIEKYRGKNNDYFWAKPDFLIKLQCDLLEEICEMKKFVGQFISIYLKGMERELGDTMEFISEYDNRECLSELKMKMDALIKDLNLKDVNRLTENRYSFSKTDFDRILHEFSSLLPESWSRKALKKCVQQMCIEQQPHILQCSYSICSYQCRSIAAFFEDIVQCFPHLFRPYSTTNVEKPFTLRVFEFPKGQYKFSIKSEYNEIMDRLDNTKTQNEDPPEYPQVMEYWETYDRPLVVAKVHKLSTRFERTVRGRPVKLLQGGHCQPIAFVLADILQRVGIGFKLFQRVKPDHSQKTLKDLVALIWRHFPKKSNVYLIKRKYYEQITPHFEQFCKPFVHRPVVEVPDLVPNQAYLKKDLRVMFEKMVSKEVLPARDDVLFRILEHVMRSSKDWRTHHIFRVLEGVQFFCFEEFAPDVKEFLMQQDR